MISIIDMIEIKVSQFNFGQQNSLSDSKNHSSLAFESSPFFLILNGPKKFLGSSP